MKKENLAIVEMLLCAALWSIAGIFMKLIPWNGFAMAGMRSLIAGLTFAVYMVITRRRFIINTKTLLSGVLTGCVYTCFAVSNKLTTAANAIVLQFTSPVFIVIFSAIIFRQRIKKNDMYVVIATLIGIALFFFDQLKPGYILGNFVAIAAGMFMAGMFMAVGNLEGDARFSAIFIGQMFTFLVGLPFIITTKPEFTFTATLSIIILGVFQLGISYILYVHASKYCPPLACCLLGALEPLLNPVWVFLFDGERPGIFALVGAVIVVVSITVWCIFGQKDEDAESVKSEA
ncbi:MAG: EamA family transporter [Oscillospiraceae bacterium]|nr:EamA family transporter [Oscillospiraceae bacterium]